MLTTPSLGAFISFSIFIASSTNSTSPLDTDSPSLTFILFIVPGSGEVTDEADAAAGAACFSVSFDVDAAG